jgi:hypothetical protein
LLKGIAMPIYLKMTWKTQQDAHVCPICKELDGYIWTVEAGDTCPKKLCHPTYGPVYDIRPVVEGSLVKEEKGHVCRCSIKHEFDISDGADGETGAIEKSDYDTGK